MEFQDVDFKYTRILTDKFIDLFNCLLTLSLDIKPDEINKIALEQNKIRKKECELLDTDSISEPKLLESDEINSIIFEQIQALKDECDLLNIHINFESELQKYLQNYDSKKFIVILGSLKKEVTKCKSVLEGSSLYVKNSQNPLFWYINHFVYHTYSVIEKFTKIDNEHVYIKANNQKIDWNANTNVLYDLFRQLKNIIGKNNNPIIPNSIPEVAIFLKNSFTALENVSLSTIETQLKNSSNNPNERPTQNKRIELIIKKSE